MMVLEGHGLDVAPKSKVANMLFLAAKITSQLGLKKPDGEGPPLFECLLWTKLGTRH